MSRYALGRPYKTHWVCFHCRKMFKRNNFCEWPDSQKRRFSTEPIARCPQCRVPMTDMGVDFRPPRKADRKAWRTANSLAKQGIYFCDGVGVKRQKAWELWFSRCEMDSWGPFHDLMPKKRRRRTLNR